MRCPQPMLLLVPVLRSSQKVSKAFCMMIKPAGVNLLNRCAQPEDSAASAAIPSESTIKAEPTDTSTGSCTNLPRQQDGSDMTTHKLAPPTRTETLDMNKINALRRAINSGHYEINAYRMAIKIVQQESKLFGL